MIKMANIATKVVMTLEDLGHATHKWDILSPLVADVETLGTDPNNGKLLGIALCPVYAPGCPIYVCLQWYDHKTSTWHTNANLGAFKSKLKGILGHASLVGHNYAYDKLWIEANLGIKTYWSACTRLMWHMASAPSGPRGYGLKDAQIEVLGWEKRGSDELEAQVEARGGKLKEGGHYLADKEVLGHYACLDASSTALLYKELSRFFDEHDYWWMLDKMVQYSWLLQECTTAGIEVDTPRLEEQVKVLADTKAAYASQFIELAEKEINRLERMWRDDRAARYTVQAAKERFLGSWEMQKKFNLSSDKDKRELFYDAMKLPIVIETDGGKGSTALEAVKASIEAFTKDNTNKEHLTSLLEAYEETERAETLLNSFAKPWLNVSMGGRLHPRFNPCGTVSYRLSGFKPYLLNAPFDEKDLMSCLKCDEGWEGVHADFVSVEPAVTAHYSQDPSLLKVFRDGLGDVYLDLARTLFPNDKELQESYNPNEPITSQIKERFKSQRKVAKIIQLAVQYTGTKYTVSKNLTFAGFPTSLGEADALVQAYWQHFRKVAIMNEALFLRFEKQGYLRNAVGRIVRVPRYVNIKKKDGTIWEKPTRYKDLPNRFIQSSAHDCLSFWVLCINRFVQKQGLRARPVILDCHDSTSWQVPKEEIEALEQVFKDALTELNESVKMSVPIRAEMKRFTTLAGLKGTEI
jgi:DNA polymerase I-like protein with 3'-5' exonuclease and polymerase domains